MHRDLRLELGEIVGPIDGYLKKVDEEIRRQLSTGIPILDESAFHLFARGGKKIRASLIILSSGLKQEPGNSVLELAAAAEIVHCASLIHDDIIDQSSMRRGVPTVSAKWGSRVAVLTGDYMYTKALGIAVGDRSRDVFPILVSATSDMVKGELYQLEYSSIDRITKQHYLNIIELKTARFLAACMKLGAVRGGMSDAESMDLYNAGLNLGFAFQIVDDALDAAGSAAQTGKDSGNDFMEGKITLPLLHLLEVCDAAERTRISEFARSPRAADWPYVQERIRAAGGLKYCRVTAEQYTAAFNGYIEGIPDSPYKRIILDLAKFLVERNY